jgi:hypothetical protein
MPEVEHSEIDPLIAEYFLNALLASSSEIAAFCGERVAAGKDGFEPSRFGNPEERNNWPFILFGPAEGSLQEMYAEQWATLEQGVYYVRAFMREDLLSSREIDLEEFTARGLKAINSALQKWKPTSVTTTDSLGNTISGYVSGCEILKPVYRELSGEIGRQRCEMGRTVRITFS